MQLSFGFRYSFSAGARKGGLQDKYGRVGRKNYIVIDELASQRHALFHAQVFSSEVIMRSTMQRKRITPEDTFFTSGSGG